MNAVYLDDVIEALNEHLNVKFPTIEGLTPSQVLSELAPDIYNAHLEQFIYDHYKQFTVNEETMYISRILL